MANPNINYEALKAELEIQLGKLKRFINIYSYCRLTVFAVAVLGAYLFFNKGLVALSVIALLMIVAFLILVKQQVKYQSVYDFAQTKLQLVENEIGLSIGTANIYPNGNEYQDPNHVYTDDLDVFGEFSLFAYLNRTVTIKGKSILANWLNKSAIKTTIEKRQSAIKEIAIYKEEILNFRTRLFNLDINQAPKIENFFKDYLPANIGFVSSKFVSFMIIAVTIINPILFMFAVFIGGVFWSLLSLGLLASATLYFIYKAKIDHIHENIGSSVTVLQGYAPNIKWIEEVNWQSELLQEKANDIKSSQPLHQQIADLAGILNSLNSRLNLIVGVFLNLFFQWDLRCLKRLAKWERNNQTNIVKGISLIGEFEALITLATLNLNHPKWSTPVISDSYLFNAQDLGHPLIKVENRVSNNFQLAKNPTIAIITGSNMAGKSTFLRTVGVNMVLAFAGANVCANQFESSVFNLITYMRIKDSLASQTSTFKAEIDRLKMILDITKTDEHTFVLVDEMLRGTNSRDKYLGSKVFIKALIKQHTPGFIATHDLQIAELANEFPQQIRNYHFDIQIKNEEMYFDYKIKVGECKTFNASILLKAIGLNVNE
nr:DNA mismatch repair protein MutS [uncultured Pedobacter sp.]